MGPNQGLEALLEGSNRNSDYQTVSKFDNLIVESSNSTRRIQRAQERRNPTSLSQKIVHQTIHNQGIQYRPSALQSAGPPTQGPTSCLRPDLLLKARRPAQGLTCCSRPDLLLKARHPPQGQTSCSRLDDLLKALLKARRFIQGQTIYLRPDALLKARHYA
ncbi:hypothetical protein M5K25_010360 [Dendrobium thyrsiflorum]|uniref:Uncharacterized protein n=1 Tax=Dendrobium thyrsiflorum TaxID=117978 RepID=A0ABD0V0E5_DENTH